MASRRDNIARDLACYGADPKATDRRDRTVDKHSQPQSRNVGWLKIITEWNPLQVCRRTAGPVPCLFLPLSSTAMPLLRHRRHITAWHTGSDCRILRMRFGPFRQVATECRNIPALKWLLHEHADNLFQTAVSTPPVFHIARSIQAYPGAEPVCQKVLGTATSTSSWSNFHAFLSSAPPPRAPCHVIYFVYIVNGC